MEVDVSPKEHKTSTSALNQKFGTHTEEVIERDQNTETSDETVKLDHPTYETIQQQLTETEKKATEYWERLLRMQAEADNRERRIERDIANAHKFALEKFILELLPVIDNLERAIATHMDEESGTGSLLDGVSLTLKMFNSALEKFGVEVVNPIKEPFNPELHQAVSVKPDSKEKPGSIIEVLQKGYLLNKRLIRPALVIVTK